MRELVIEQPASFLFPDPQIGSSITLALIGCGGTGSFIAQSIARLAAHNKALGGAPLRIFFVDGDDIDERNVGRQLFAPGEIGQNKAITLANRFNFALGLQIQAVPRMATVDVLRKLLPEAWNRHSSTSWGLLIGAVDGAPGRMTMNSALKSHGAFWRGYLDSGNHQYSGQVALGSTTDMTRMRRAIQMGIANALPAPTILYPELLKAAEIDPAIDCAAAMAANLQSLMVNQMMAAIVAEYLYQIVLNRRIGIYKTSVDIRSMTMRSTPITASALAEDLGMTVEQIAPPLQPAAPRTRGQAA